MLRRCVQTSAGPQQGFTLVELLVVITILALLFALLSPALKSGIDSSRQAACNESLRALGVAFAGYGGANNTCIPKAATAYYPKMNSDGTATIDSNGDWTSTGPQLSWMTVLAQGNYVQHGAQVSGTLWHTKAFMCPTDPRKDNRDFLNCYFMPTSCACYGPCCANQNAGGWDSSQSYYHPVSAGVLDPCYHYSFPDSNGDWIPFAHGLADAPMPHLKMSSIPDPPGTLQLIEGIGLWYYDWWDSSEAWGPDMWNIAHGTPYYPDSSWCRRHRRNGQAGQEALMCDGSAKWVQVEHLAGATFQKVFDSNNLNWDTCDQWYSTYHDALYANGVGGAWTIQPND